MPPSPRKSLTEAFPSLKIPHQQPQRPKMKQNLTTTMMRGWPSWATLHRGSVPSTPTTFTIRLASFLREEATKCGFSQDPAVIIHDIRQKSSSLGMDRQAEMWRKVEDSLVRLVYGSNYIENVGSSFDITIKICQQVFRGLPIADTIDARDPEYEQHLRALVARNRQANQSEVIRSRREIIQHAQALNFLIEHIVLNSEAWTEQLLLDAHEMLYRGLESNRDDVMPGQYREERVAASYVDPNDPKKKARVHQFIRPSVVREYMAQFIENLNGEILEAEKTGDMDPYQLAAKYHHQFVCIHPFGDGNGRMSRMILNVLLLKYAGHMTSFGGNDEEKDVYIGIAYRAGKRFYQEDGEIPVASQTGHHELARFVLTQSKHQLESLWGWVKTNTVKDRRKGKETGVA